MSTLNRRGFLKRSTAAAAAGLLAGSGARAGNLCEMPQKWEKELDVIVVGGGGAGLAAAITAAEAGASVAVLEKMAFPGGNTMISGGGMNAAMVEEARAAGIEDSPELHARQTLAAGDFRADPDLVRTYTENVPATVEWLKTLGIEFSKIYQIFGGLWPRCRNPQGQRGYAYTEAEIRRLKELGVPVFVNHKVTAVLRESPTEGRVIGVEIETEGQKHYWRAQKGVVACAGGFAANAQMCSFFDPRFSNLNTSNQPGATGEVLIAMQDIGALATGLDYIQCIPGRPVGFKSYSNLIQNIGNAIFLNKEGRRFVAEDSRRDVIRDATLAQSDHLMYPVTDAEGYEAINRVTDHNEKALKDGTLFMADTLEELAAKAGLPPEAFRESVTAYNAMVDSKAADPLGRATKTMSHKIAKPPFYCGPMGMVRHHTMGGVRIDTEARVLDRMGRVIPGLYAAGEVTGGIHGTNRVGGNAVGDCLTFGRIAGASAAKAL